MSGDPSRVTPLSTGIGSFLPEGFRIPVLGWTVTRPEANSNYDTVVVVGEYDLTADFPDRPWNVLALVNSLFGFQSSHGPSALSSPTEVPEENIRETENDKGATTTTYLVPETGATHAQTTQRCAATPSHQRGQQHAQADRGPRLFAQRRQQRQPRPYLQPTDGLPRLVMPTRVTHSFKATPNASALPRLDRALKALLRKPGKAQQLRCSGSAT